MIQKKLENGSKLLISNFIFRNRHFLAFVTIIIFLLIYGGSISFAMVWPADSGVSSSDTIISYYDGVDDNGTYAYLNTSDMLDYMTSKGISTNGFSNMFMGGGIDANSSANILTNMYKFPTSVSRGGDNYTVAVSGPRCWTYTNISGYTCYYSYMFDGAGQFALIHNSNSHNYIVSDQYFTACTWQDGTIGSNYGVDTDVTPRLSTSGYYYYALDDNYNTEYLNFTNLPIYICSINGDTGLSDIDDFSFSGTYLNCNYPFMNNSFVDPDAVIPEIENDAKYHLTFRDSTYYSGKGLNQFWHNNNFTFTEYQINNPTYYRLRFSYRVEFANNLGTDSVYTYTPSNDVQLAYFLGQANRLGTGSRIGVPLCSDWFVNSNNETLTHAIITTINAVTGTSTQYVNANGLFENVFDWLTSANNYYWGTENSDSLQSVLPVYGGIITKFRIIGDVSLYNSVNSNYESYSYQDSHNFLDGSGEVLSTENTVPPYEESPIPVYEDLPSSGTGGGISAGSGSAIATVEKGAVQVTVNSGGGLTPAFQIDDVNIANVAQTMNDVVSFFGNDRNQNGFWGLMKSVYDFLPEGIWSAIAIGVSTVLGIAIVKVTLSYFRK